MIHDKMAALLLRWSSNVRDELFLIGNDLTVLKLSTIKVRRMILEFINSPVMVTQTGLADIKGIL